MFIDSGTQKANRYCAPQVPDAAVLMAESSCIAAELEGGWNLEAATA
jgi:hypothetical protein